MAPGRKAKGTLRPGFVQPPRVTSAAPPAAPAGTESASAAPTPGTAVPSPPQSPRPGGAGVCPPPPPPRARRCRCLPQPPPARAWWCRCPPRPPPPRARQAPRQSPSNGQSTRDSGGFSPQVVQRYLIYPAGHRAALTPHKSLEQGAGSVGQSAPAAQGTQSCWRSPRAPAPIFSYRGRSSPL